MKPLELSNITLKMLIDNAIIHSGEVIVCMKNRGISGKILDDGLISLEMENSTVTYLSLSGAAKAVENISINGWTYWGIIKNEEIQDLATYRKRFYDMLQNL